METKRGKKNKRAHEAQPVVLLMFFYHILMSSVIYYCTDPQQRKTDLSNYRDDERLFMVTSSMRLSSNRT